MNRTLACPLKVQAGENSTLLLTCDGMDQAKFRIPRNTAMMRSKQADGLWRPQEHCVGVLASGVGEYFYLLPPDAPGGSGMVVTLLAHTLDLVAETLAARGFHGPRFA
jgi:hypothetical protein